MLLQHGVLALLPALLSKPKKALRKEAPAEEEVLLNAYARIGSKWAEMEKILPGRTENAIKNHWYASVRRQARVAEKEGNAARFDGKTWDENGPFGKPLLSPKESTSSSLPG